MTLPTAKAGRFSLRVPLAPGCRRRDARMPRGKDLAIKTKPVGSPLTHGRCLHRKKTRNNAVSNRLRQAGPPASSTICVLAVLNCVSHCRVRLLCMGQARIGLRECFRRSTGANPTEKQHTSVIKDRQVDRDWIKGSRCGERLKRLAEQVEIRKESAARDNGEDSGELHHKEIESCVRCTIGGIVYLIVLI